MRTILGFRPFLLTSSVKEIAAQISWQRWVTPYPGSFGLTIFQLRWNLSFIGTDAAYLTIIPIIFFWVVFFLCFCFCFLFLIWWVLVWSPHSCNYYFPLFFNKFFDVASWCLSFLPTYQKKTITTNKKVEITTKILDDDNNLQKSCKDIFSSMKNLASNINLHAFMAKIKTLFA